MIPITLVRPICWPGQNGATFYAKNGRFWLFLLLYSYSNAARTQLIFKNVIYDKTFKYKKSQASQSCLKSEKTTKKWPKIAILAHIWPFLPQYSLVIGTITHFMLNTVKYNHTVAFFKNWHTARLKFSKKGQKIAIFGSFCYFIPILMQQEHSWSSKMSFMTTI